VGKFRSIKALVIDHVHRRRGMVDYDELSREVLAQSPSSKWKPSHWAMAVK